MQKPPLCRGGLLVCDLILEMALEADGHAGEEVYIVGFSGESDIDAGVEDGLF